MSPARPAPAKRQAGPGRRRKVATPTRMRERSMECKRQKELRVALVVLGMHRSGTSALAGALTFLGCDGPATPMKPTPDNAKGYFEPEPLYPLHSELLNSAASRWDDWLPVEASWLDSGQAEEFRLRAIALIDEQFGESPLFVLKDPRICRLVPFWAKVMDDMDVTPRYILTHRNPLEVGQSLHKRDGMEMEIALLIWLRHVLDAEAATRGKPRCFTSYAELMTDWNGVARKIETELDVALPRLSEAATSDLEEFLSTNLRHQTVAADEALTDKRTAGWVRTVFGILEKWAAEGESEADFNALDTVRARFDGSAHVYARPLQLVQKAQEEVKKLTVESTRWAEEKETLERKLDAMRGNSAQVVANLDQTRTEQGRVAENYQDLAVMVEALRVNCAHLEDQVAALAASGDDGVGAGAAQAEAHERRIAELEIELAVTRGALDERRMTASQAETALAELRDRMIKREGAHERTISALKGDMELRVSELRTALTTQAGTLEAEVQARGIALEELRAALADQVAAAVAAEEALNQRQEEFDEYNATIVTLQGELAALQAAVEKAEVDAGERQAVIAGRLADREALAQRLERSLDERTRELAELTRIIVRRETEQAEAERALAERHREFAHLQQIGATRESERDEEARKLAQRGEEIEALRQHVAALEAETAAQRAYIAELFVSRSWKVTKPLRSVSTAARRVLRRG